MGGNFRPESLATMNRNRWQLSAGFSNIDNSTFTGPTFTESKILKIKYESAKNYRSHLTNDEQLFLYYNSLSPLGNEWNIRGLIKKYKLIKNIFYPHVTGYSPRDWAINELGLSSEEVNAFFEFKDKSFN